MPRRGGPGDRPARRPLTPLVASPHGPSRTGTPLNTDAADRYTIRAVLGRGGMGVVHRATDRATGATVALKRLAAAHADDGAFRTRFVREVRAMSRIHHPNVVGIHASGEDADGPWFAMDLCEDGSLADRLRDGPLTPDEARSLAVDVLSALAAIHGAGLIHRDVKPPNILRDDDRWRVSDFGIVRDTTGATTVTQAGMIIGTPDYLAPEHFRESPVGPAADLYALGAMLHHALTGSPPYRADNALRLAMLHATAPPPVLPDGIRASAPALASVVDGLMRKDPRERLTVAEAHGRLVHDADAPTIIAPAVGVGIAPEARTVTLVPRRRPFGRYAIAATLGAVTLALGAAWIAGDGAPGGPSGGAATPPAATTPRAAPSPATAVPLIPAPVASPPTPVPPPVDDGPADVDDHPDDEDDTDDGYDDDHEDEYGDHDEEYDVDEWAGPGRNGQGEAKGRHKHRGGHPKHR